MRSLLPRLPGPTAAWRLHLTGQPVRASPRDWAEFLRFGRPSAWPCPGYEEVSPPAARRSRPYPRVSRAREKTPRTFLGAPRSFPCTSNYLDMDEDSRIAANWRRCFAHENIRQCYLPVTWDYFELFVIIPRLGPVRERIFRNVCLFLETFPVIYPRIRPSGLFDRARRRLPEAPGARMRGPKAQEPLSSAAEKPKSRPHLSFRTIAAAPPEVSGLTCYGERQQHQEPGGVS